MLSDGAPVDAGERVQVMDVLRGVALFGVFLANLVGFASVNVMATEQQLLSLPTAAWDFTLRQVIVWLVFDKANTLFAFLFGLGFYLQMQRLEERGADFDRIYLRRLAVLLVIGTIHLLFIWTWDILHLYALAGFVLFTMRDAGNRDLLAIGAILALIGRSVQKTFAEFTPLSSWTGQSNGYDEASVHVRQQLSESGDYFGIVRNFFDWVVIDYVASALLLGWLCYVLGRFLIGAWVGRHGWITRAREFLPEWRRLALWSLPLGLLLEGAATMLSESEGKHREYFGEMLHLFAVPVLAVGYVSLLVTWFHSPRGARWLAPFAWSGRMALTNYLTQSFVIAFVLFGVGPGLALAGRVGTCALAAIVVVAYALQILFSRWWLRRFAYGPAEWVWRMFTYGTRPSWRVAAPES